MSFLKNRVGTPHLRDSHPVFEKIKKFLQTESHSEDKPAVSNIDSVISRF